MRTQWNFCGEHPAKYGWVCAGILPKMSGDTESQKSTQCRGGVQIIFDCSSCQDDMHKSCEKCNKFQCSCMENPCTYREAFKVREKHAPAHRFKWGTVSCVRLREIVFSGYFPVNQFLRVMIRQSVFFHNQVPCRCFPSQSMDRSGICKSNETCECAWTVAGNSVPIHVIDI